MSNRPSRKRQRQAEHRAEKRAAEFVRSYHSEERVAFVRALPCVGCGHRPSENAHTKVDGMARKAGYETIVPLCGPHFSMERRQPVPGCHLELHNHGVITFMRRHDVDLAAKARETEEAWQKHRAAQPTD